MILILGKIWQCSKRRTKGLTSAKVEAVLTM